MDRRRSGGFTLVELMIVVVIISILAAIATVGFRRYIARARSSEAVAMLAEMSSKEQTYRLEFATYVPLRADNNATLPSPDEGAGAFFPTSPNSDAFESARTPTQIGDKSAWPDGWKAAGLNPRDTQLYCTYMANAGNGGDAVPGGAKLGTILVGTSTGAPWFYALAACNLDSTAGYPDDVSIFALSSVSSTLRTFNENR